MVIHDRDEREKKKRINRDLSCRYIESIMLSLDERDVLPSIDRLLIDLMDVLSQGKNEEPVIAAHKAFHAKREALAIRYPGDE